MKREITPQEWIELAGDRIDRHDLPAGALELAAAAAIAQGSPPPDQYPTLLPHVAAMFDAARLILNELRQHAEPAELQVLELLDDGAGAPASELYSVLVDLVGRMPTNAKRGTLSLSVYLTPLEWARLQAGGGAGSISKRVVEALARDRRVARLLQLVDGAGAGLYPAIVLERLREVYQIEPAALEASPW